MLLKFLLLFAVFSTYRCQFGDLCPDIADDIKSCADDSIATIDGLAGRFSSATSVLNFGNLIATFNAVCNYTTPLQNFLRCFYTKFLACIPQEWTKALPSTENVIDSISYFCDNVGDIDLPCVANNSQEVSTCVLSALDKPTQDLTTVDAYISYICKVPPISESCYGSVLSVCGGRTSEVLAEYTKYQFPSACDAIMIRVSWSLLVVSLCYSWLKNMV